MRTPNMERLTSHEYIVALTDFLASQVQKFGELSLQPTGRIHVHGKK